MVKVTDSLWKEIDRNVFYNKKTGQPSIVLPKGFFKKGPKTIKIRIPMEKKK